VWSDEASTASTALITPVIKDRKMSAGVKCIKESQNQNKKTGDKKCKISNSQQTKIQPKL
jgi:hypothetical protein